MTKCIDLSVFENEIDTQKYRLDITLTIQIDGLPILDKIRVHTQKQRNDTMKYTETRRSIFLAIAKNGGAKISDIAKNNGISEMRARYHIAQIRNDFDSVYTIQVTPIGSEQYGQGDAIYNAIYK